MSSILFLIRKRPTLKADFPMKSKIRQILPIYIIYLVLKHLLYFNLFSLRKVQNYDWADDCIQKGKDMLKRYSSTKDKFDIEKAIENFKDAEKLDPLNKEIYIQKGLAYMVIVCF